MSLDIERAQLLYSASEATRALEAEQNQIARYLHDTLGDNLAYLRLKLEQLSSEHDYMELSIIHRDLETMREIADECMNQFRSSLTQLWVSTSQDLASALHEMAKSIGERSNIQVKYESIGIPHEFPPHVQRQILYIVREILRNVEKHSKASQVGLNITWADDGLTLEACDNGQGFDLSAVEGRQGHFGLKFITEISTELNGRLVITTSPGDGFSAKLWLPKG